MKIVIITLCVYWVIGLIISIVDEDKAIYWAVGLAYPVALILTYPYRAIYTYRRSCNYYKKNNVSMLQYFFGKRVKDK